MRYLLSVAALLFITSIGLGQDFIVTMKNDTLKGDIKILSYDLMDRVQFSDGKKKTMYTAVQLRSLSFKNEVYAPVKFDNTIRMMKVIRSGFLSLYAFKFPNQVTYDGKLLVKMGNTPQEVPNLGFKRYIGGVVEDCPTVSEKVKNGDYNRNNIEQLVIEYNGCVANTQEQRFESVTNKVSNSTTDFIEQLRERVNKSDLTTKNEVNDLLNSITDRVKKNEPVPAYMKDGLKGYLSVRDDFKEDTEQLLLLLNK
ncbi:MAG TPA: hypothetical protein VFE50_02920 [Cyclobacteriaceae bacterium]|nr:hypothetical protein [Cyclobacteriaceae bacterium]